MSSSHLIPVIALIFAIIDAIDLDPNTFTLDYANDPRNNSMAKKEINDPEIEFLELTYNNNANQIYGYQPQLNLLDGYPLYVFVTGTNMSYWDGTCSSYTQYMAHNGFVAVSVQYSNTLYPVSCSQSLPGSFVIKARLLWDLSNPQSAISVLCNSNTLKINCDKGIVTSGMSQGAQLASMAAVYDADITAMYIMGGGDVVYQGGIPLRNYPCLSYPSLRINQNRIRSMVGEDDGYFGVDQSGVRTQQISITGYQCAASSVDCIQQDGSGWYIVTKGQTETGSAVHCYAYQGQSCQSGGFDPNYINPSTLYWGYDSNLNWLINRVYS